MAVTKKGRSVVTVFCDASFCHQTKAGGWGFWIKTDEVEKAGGGPMQSRPMDPSEAELMAVANSLYYVVAQNIAKEGDRIVFGIDNQWVVHLLNGSTTIKGDKPQCQAALKFIKDMRKRMNFELKFRKVKAHNPNGGGRCRVNEVADKHAKKGMRAARKELEKKE